jgi:L-threonylcarbamoyladenylate synthase
MEKAADTIRQGGLVAAPTDTVYGLLADATNSAAVERLFDAKGREGVKPISIFFESPENVSLFCKVSEIARRFIKKLLPGPYTFVLPFLPSKRATGTPIAKRLYAQGTLGVRVISNPTILHLLGLAKVPLTATSANPSGMSPATSVEELSPLLLEKIDGVIDGGRTRGGASTVISFVEGNPVVLREGEGLAAFRRAYEELCK